MGLTTSAEYKNESLDICDFEIRAIFQVITDVAFIILRCVIRRVFPDFAKERGAFEMSATDSTPYNILETVLKSCFFGSNWLFNKTPMGWTVWRS